MENRSNQVIVGSVALAMIVGILIMILWLARYSGSERKEFDILFATSVTGWRWDRRCSSTASPWARSTKSA